MKLHLVLALAAILCFATTTTTIGQVRADDCGPADFEDNSESDCVSDTKYNDDGSTETSYYDGGDDNNNNDNKDDDNNKNNDNNDKSETSSKDNDPCDYNGLDVCDKDHKGCDNHNFDCLTDLEDGNYCTTGMCPGDDKKSSGSNHNDNHKKNGNNCDSSYPDFCIESPPPDLNCGDISKNNFKVSGSDPHGFDGDNDGKGCESPGSGSGGNGNGNGNDKRSSSNNDNHKSTSDNNNGGDNNHQSSSCCYDSKKGFNIDIILDNQYNSNDKKYEVRVIVYGVHTLNKPTLDKPGKTVYISNLEYTNVGTWSFSDWKVSNGDTIKACAINLRTHQESCGYGVANKGQVDTIHIPQPNFSEMTGNEVACNGNMTEFGCVPLSNTETKVSSLMTPYANTTIGIKVEYPSNFEKLNFGNSIAFHTPLQLNENIFSEQVGILTLDVLPSDNYSTNQFLLQQFNNFRSSFPNYSLFEGPISIKLNGNPALQAQFVSRIDNIKNQIMEIWTINRDSSRAYQVEVSVGADKYPSFPPEHIQRMIDSLQIQDASIGLKQDVEVPSTTPCLDGIGGNSSYLVLGTGQMVCSL